MFWDYDMKAASIQNCKEKRTVIQKYLCFNWYFGYQKNSYLIFCPLEFSSVFCADDCYRDINEHADEDDETKVDVKIIGKSNDGNDDINDDGDKRKKQGIKDFSDWICSSVHNSENLSELSSIMPSDPKSMQMVKKVQFESFNSALTYTKLNKNI